MSFDPDTKQRIRTAVIALIVFAASGAVAYTLFRRFREANEAPRLSSVEDPRPLPEYDFAYASNKDGDYDLYLTTLSGDVELKLTDNPLPETDPAWSPDGSLIAYVVGPRGDTDIWVTAVSEGAAQRLTSTPGEETDPTWSPDGTQVAYARGFNIEVVSLNGAAPRRLTDGSASDYQPAWSPDGNQIAYVHAPQNNRAESDLWFVEAPPATARRSLTEMPGSERDPAWSPTSGRLAFVGTETGTAEIYLLHFPDRAVRLVSKDQLPKSSPSWSPNGARILYAGGSAGTTDLYVIDAEGFKDAQKVVAGPGEDTSPAWNPVAGSAK